MLYLNKSRLQKGIPSKLQMRRIWPCKFLEKYGPNAYKIDLPKDMDLSPISNFKDLVPYKGPKMDDIEYQEEMKNDVLDLKLPERKQLQVEKILDSRVKKSTRKKVYKEHLVIWMDLHEAEANWIAKSDFKKIGISNEFLSPTVP